MISTDLLSSWEKWFQLFLLQMWNMILCNISVLYLTLSLMAGAIQWPPLAKSAPVLQGRRFEWPQLMTIPIWVYIWRFFCLLGKNISRKKFRAMLLRQGSCWKIKFCIIMCSKKYFSVLYMWKTHASHLTVVNLRSATPKTNQKPQKCQKLGWYKIWLQMQKHVPNTCRTRVWHVRPLPINFLTSRTPN